MVSFRMKIPVLLQYKTEEDLQVLKELMKLGVRDYYVVGSYSVHTHYALILWTHIILKRDDGKYTLTLSSGSPIVVYSHEMLAEQDVNSELQCTVYNTMAKFDEYFYPHDIAESLAQFM